MIPALTSPRNILILAGAALVAALSYRDAALAYWRAQPPARVPAYLSDDPVIAVNQAEFALMTPGGPSSGPPPSPTAITANAVAALRQTPLNSTAIFELGTARSRQGGNGRPFFDLAERVTRREISNELQLIDLADAEGDARALLAHADRVLSVAPEFAGKLIPVLAQSLADERLRDSVGAYAARSWYPALLNAAVTAGNTPDVMLPLLAQARPFWPAGNFDRLYPRIATDAVNAGNFAAAARVLRFLGQEGHHDLETFGFTPATTDPDLAPLTWRLANEEGKRASLAGDGSLEIEIASDQMAAAATRMTFLAPGTYSFTQTLAFDAARPAAGLAWTVACPGPAVSPLWRQPVPARPGQVTYMSTLTIPAHCAAQVWQLTATGDADQRSSTASIREIAVARADRAGSGA